MRARKKYAVCLMICIIPLQGCTRHNSAIQDTTKVKVAVFDGAYNNAYWDDVATRFEKLHPGVKIELDINENIGNILLPRMLGNTLPDVVYLGSSNASGFTQTMIKEEQIASLSDIFTTDLNKQFMVNILDNFAIRPYPDKEVYLAPLYFNATGLWYNNTVFEEYGYQVPTTWDEFFSLGDQAKGDGLDLFVYQGLNPTYLEALLWPMLAEKIGLQNLDKIYQSQKDAWSQDGVFEVLSTFERLHTYMQSDTISLSYMQAQQRFVEGKALFIPCGNWLETEMQEFIQPCDEFRMMSVPSYQNNAKQYATIMLEQIYVPKSAKQVELGKEFVAFQFTSESVASNEEISGGVVPVLQEARSIKEQPYQMFEEGVIPISANFSPLLKLDMNREVFEQVSNIIAGTSNVQEAIDYLNMWTHE